MPTKPALDFISQSPEQTLLAGEHLGAVCEGGEVLWLSGALGSGKTVFAQGVAKGLGIVEQVTSPTFTVLKEYRGRLSLFHFDFYRFEGQARDAVMEFEEYQRPDSVCVVEWAEHAIDFLPHEHLRIAIRLVSPSKRSIQVYAHGSRYESLLQRFQALAFRP
jgi:tRNA threonylcarbamoyladenosine biosynthesis protein TsaE